MQDIAKIVKQCDACVGLTFHWLKNVNVLHAVAFTHTVMIPMFKASYECINCRKCESCDGYYRMDLDICRSLSNWRGLSGWRGQLQ